MPAQTSKSDPVEPRLNSGVTARQLIEFSPLAMGLYKPHGELAACSASWRVILPDTEANRAALRDGAAAWRALLARCCDGATEMTPSFPILSESGEQRWVRLELGPWRNAEGEVAYIVAHGADVTDEEVARQAQRRSEERLTAALGIDRTVVKEIDFRTGETTLWGEDGPLKEAMVGFGLHMDHVHPDDRAALRALVAAHPADSELPFRAEYRLNDAAATWVSTVSRPAYDEHGAMAHAIIVSQDITERMNARRNMERVAFTDALTGLPNRAKFQLEFDLAVAEAEASGRPLGLVMVDVDHFKDINDTLGHDAGDALLEALAGHMRNVFRHDDLVARLGGDEFAILLRDVASEADMVRPLHVLRTALASPVQHKGQGFRIATSVGAALHVDPDADASHLLKNADIALYKAKQAGRDQVVLFEPQMRSEVEKRLELLRDVRAAIPRGEFTLFYQPVLNVSDEEVVGFEALMRWNHPDHGVLSPASFIEAFEDQDLSLQLGEVAIETALKQMRAWLDADLPFGRVSINLSPAQFRTGRLAADLCARLLFWGVPAERLTVEVTENVYLGWGAEIVSETVRALHDRGVTIALDDFGTGYASLANLRQFPIDRLKIDKSFVQNSEDDAIVRAVINLGASMGMEVVAEGVEKQEQLSALTRYGCKHVQGFHFSEPMPAPEVPNYLSAAKAAPRSAA